jgi:hypothetical protein
MKKLSDLRVGQKLVLLAIVFLVPTLAVIAALFLLVQRISIDFARDEIDGVRVVRPIVDLVQVLQQNRALAQGVARRSEGVERKGWEETRDLLKARFWMSRRCCRAILGQRSRDPSSSCHPCR